MKANLAAPTVTRTPSPGRCILALCLAALLLAAACPAALARPAGQAQSTGRDEAFERAILERLGAISPAAVPLFQQATAAADAGDLIAAKQGFEQVLALAPDFPDALRRLSYAELELAQLEHRDVSAALLHARRAYILDASPYNALAVAGALLLVEDKASDTEALVLAKLAAAELPDDPFANLILLEAAAANRDVVTLRQADARLLKLAPNHPYAHLMAGLLAADDGKWEESERELLRARDLGWPAQDIQALFDKYNIPSRAQTDRETHQRLQALGYTVAGWLVGMVALFLLGLALSALTLAAVRRPPQVDTFRLGTGERIVRGLYAVVVALTSAYFYLSLPVLAAVVVVGAIFICVVLPISIYLMAVVAITAFYTLAAIVWSVLTRTREGELGRELPRAEAPGLWTLAEEIARRTGTRPVDAIYVTPWVTVAVTERGSLTQKLRGLGKRCLVVGLGALQAMTQAEFAAILAHEYGHFSNRDTAGGNLAFQVRVSIYNMAFQLARRGLARWYNPAWLFINGYNRVFLRLTLGASRLQEILADRYAVMAYGVRNFVDGLTRIVRLDLAFALQVDQEAKLADAENRTLHNLYTLPPLDATAEQDTLAKRMADVMGRPTSPYDSHPAVNERFRLVAPLAGRYDISGRQEPVWALFQDPDALQTEMTALVQKDVAAQLAAQRAERAAFHRKLAAESVPAIKPYQEALAKTIEARDAEAEAEALQDLGNAYEERGLHDRAKTYYQLALTSYLERKDQEGERTARFNLAGVHQAAGEFKEAAEQLALVVALDEATDSPELEADRAALAEVSRLRSEEGKRSRRWTLRH